ncbi:MAG: hypothetical protein AB1374_08215 [Bacillota bacterium]
MNRVRVSAVISALLVLMLAVVAVEGQRGRELAGRRAAVAPGAAGEVG